MTDSQSSPAWRRSSRCDTSTCLEAAIVGEGIALRDSKDPDGPILRFSRKEWSSFLAGVRQGDFQLS